MSKTKEDQNAYQMMVGRAGTLNPREATIYSLLDDPSKLASKFWTYQGNIIAEVHDPAHVNLERYCMDIDDILITVITNRGETISMPVHHQESAYY